MRFVHRISLRANRAQQRELEALGVKLPKGLLLPGGGDPFFAFDVDEEHLNWPRLRDLFQQWSVSGLLRTEFSQRELDSARWLEVGAWHHGYPQPDEGDFGYLQATYDLVDWCDRCDIGKKQKAPFQMRREPKWGRNGIMQLIWVYDELFVTPDVWSSVFKPYGIRCRPVMNTKQLELKTVVQLVVEEEVGLVAAGLPAERCGRCGRLKYLPVTRGPFPALAEEPSQPIARTREYFGSGGEAAKGVLISRGIAAALKAASVRGASLTPVQGA